MVKHSAALVLAAATVLTSTAVWADAYPGLAEPGRYPYAGPAQPQDPRAPDLRAPDPRTPDPRTHDARAAQGGAWRNPVRQDAGLAYGPQPSERRGGAYVDDRAGGYRGAYPSRGDQRQIQGGRIGSAELYVGVGGGYAGAPAPVYGPPVEFYRAPMADDAAQVYQSDQTEAYQTSAYEAQTASVSGYESDADQAQAYAPPARALYQQASYQAAAGGQTDCPTGAPGERVISCRYTPYAQAPEAPAQQAVEISDLFFVSGGVGPDAISGGGGGGGGSPSPSVFGSGSVGAGGSSNSTSSSSASASATATATSSASSQSGSHGGGHMGGWGGSMGGGGWTGQHGGGSQGGGQMSGGWGGQSGGGSMGGGGWTGQHGGGQSGGMPMASGWGAGAAHGGSVGGAMVGHGMGGMAGGVGGGRRGGGGHARGGRR